MSRSFDFGAARGRQANHTIEARITQPLRSLSPFRMNADGNELSDKAYSPVTKTMEIERPSVDLYPSVTRGEELKQ